MSLSAQQERQIDQVFAPWDRPDSPGAALAVLLHGEVIYARGYGSANLEYGLPITPETVFHVASVSKQFTAMAVMLLVRDGLLDLHTDIHHYLPELPDFGHEITLWHLLHHTSGLRDQWELLVAAGWRMDDVITREQILKLIDQQRALNFQPGAEYLYCNTGFTLAAELVAKVSGKNLRQFCQECIFQPLGMTATHFHDDHEEIVPGRAYSYAPRVSGGWRKSVLNYANVGATSLFSTVLDLAKWLQNFEHLSVGDETVMRQLETPFRLANGQPTEYGLGLMLSEYRGQREVGHSGADAGFRAWCGRFPEHGLGIAILCNFAPAIPRDLAHQVAEVILPELRQHPAVVPLPLPEDYSGEFFLLTDGSRLTVEQSDAGLTLFWQGQQVNLSPADRETWSSPEAGLRIVGQRDGQGRISSLALQSPRMNLGARRRPDFSLDPKKLSEYVGDYRCEELSADYQLLVADGCLVLRHRRHSDTALIPASEDTFIGGGARLGEVSFRRGAQGQIIGMSWSGNRVRNLWFDRQQQQQ